MNDVPVDADAFNEFEAAGWVRQAAGYHDFFGHVTTRLVEPLLDAAESARAPECSTSERDKGYVAAGAAERGAAVVGLDRVEEMLERARLHHPELDFVQGDVEALPFAVQSFDAVLGNFILLHLGRPERAAEEFVRVLAPGGRLALTVWDVPERARILGVMVDAIAAAGARCARGDAGRAADLPLCRRGRVRAAPS